ncbi:MAG: hypothetical protein K2K49_02750 [Duncaniella sp.]|nr:hypothetical protein [Duncaniella sp.]
MDNKKNTNEFKEPKLRVSRKVYIEVINAALDEVVTWPPEEGMKFLYAVRWYLSSPLNYPRSGDSLYMPFRKFKKVIDRAAERSEKAREAARRRKERREAEAQRREVVAETIGQTIKPMPCSVTSDMQPTMVQQFNRIC